jgi:ribosomal protein S18 acetylase RimI-like enzyme
VRRGIWHDHLAMTTTVRRAEERDLDVVAGYEVRIARVSFPEDPIEDPDAHRRRLRKAMERDGGGMLVAEADGGVVGWLWVSLNTNFTTGEPYAQFRSLAVEPGHEGRGVAEALIRRGLELAREGGARQVVGRVHVDNVPMRVVYREFGFRPQHLTMRLPLR